MNKYITQTRPYKDNKLSIIILSSLPIYKKRSNGPKSLFKLNHSETYLHYQLKNLNNITIEHEIVLTVGFCADKIIKQKPNNVRIVENQLYETTNDFEELRLAFNNINTDRVLIIGGDSIFNTATINNIVNSASSSILTSNILENEKDIGVTVVDDKATILSYDLIPKWENITYLTGKELKLMKYICSDRDKNKLYMFEGLNYVLDKGGSIKIVEAK